ncbi:MAG: 8-amino-7-oxononanoate synthase [Candidatus Acidiferrum sp.]|jgi:8-amino-7-oxononanoate synthase
MPSEFHRAFQREVEDGLRNLEARDQRRSLAEIHGVNLCSNDYLGLAGSEELKAAVLDAVQEAPRVGGTGSRLLSGHLDVWEEVEQEFAEFAGTEAALYFGSGYAANVGLLTSVLRKGDVVFSDELNHASLIDGIRLSGARKVIYPHLDLNALEAGLRTHANESGLGRRFVVTESVFSMDGDVAPLAELSGLCERFGAGLILDEAHATCVHGPSGRGMAVAAGLARDLVGITHTCGKALASAGAFVCGSAALREHLINHARTFIFSTAMPPYIAGQIRAALRIAQGMDDERAQLLARSRRLATALRAQGYDTAGSRTQIVPVVIGGNEDALAAAAFLQAEGFAVRAIRPPTVKSGRARLRLSVTCAIAASELERLENCLGSWRAQRHALAAGCS